MTVPAPSRSLATRLARLGDAGARPGPTVSGAAPWAAVAGPMPRAGGARAPAASADLPTLIAPAAPAADLATRLARLASRTRTPPRAVADRAAGRAALAAMPGVEPLDHDLWRVRSRVALPVPSDAAPDMAPDVALDGMPAPCPHRDRSHAEAVAGAAACAVRRAPVAPTADASAHWRLPLDRYRSIDAPRVRTLLLDTETTGLGGSGTFAFVIGIATVGPAGVDVTQWLATAWAAEPALLAQVRAALDPAAALVTWNGRSYDVPLLRARHALLRLPDPFDDRPHADLLHATRRWLADADWADCRLQTAAQRLLGIVRGDDLPGAEVPAAWQRWLTHADGDGLARVLAHNRDDLVALAGLTAACDRWWHAATLTARRARTLRSGYRSHSPPASTESRR